MRILKLEIKRVLKTRMTQIMLLIALTFSVLSAYIPVTLVYCDDSENVEDTLYGFDAIKQEKVNKKNISGEISQNKVNEAIKIYQDTLEKYDVEETYELSLEVYDKTINPIYPILPSIGTAYGDPDGGASGSDFKQMDINMIGDYYDCLTQQNEIKLQREQGNHKMAIEFGKQMYSKVNKPFVYYSGITSDGMEYEVLCIFVILICSTVTCAPVFSTEYQTDSDSILRCTKHGRARLALTKIASALLICLSTAFVCIIMWCSLITLFFGIDGMKTSVQLIANATCFINMNMGELIITHAVIGVLLIFGSICFTLFISARCKNNVQSMAVGILAVFAPVFLYWFLPSKIADVLKCFLPAGGVGLNNSVLYDFIDFRFVSIGDISVWSPIVIVGVALLQIPLFIWLAIRSYIRHTL